MADVKIDMILADSSGSIGKRTNETKALNTELTKAQRLSAKGLAGEGGAMTSQKVVEYGRSRATMGTGAEARDFAKQSEGLSGLVRLYAVYAANLYAAGAAFRALSEAANTETMIKGMDQLGARSGIALGTLAKNFSDATGGAISLRESAEATTKAISSGLSQKQFLQLGEVAKKASQALGINLSDAVSRLTRGITKLEPELLDELGIFAKIGPATEKYANELGKPVSALTDFEKRQAFANAVLTEGIDKFGKLDLPTNPYDKLSASLKNLAQSALELVNKALLPLVSVLSQSPAALTGVLGLLGLTLIKQALPAIGQYREELKKTAEVASEVAAKKATESRATRLSAFGGALQKADDLASQAEDRASKTWAKVEEAIKKSGSKVAESVKPALAKLISKDNILDVTPKELKVLDDLGSKNTKIAATYRQLAQEIRAAQTAAQDYFQAQKAKAAAEAMPLPFFSAAGINERIAKGAASKAERSRIVSGAVEESSVGGLLSSFTKLGKETAASKEMGAVGKAMTLVQGSVGIVTNGIVRLASSLGTAGMVVGVLVGAFTMLDGWLSKTAEKSEKFNSTIQDSISAIKTYADTFKLIREEGDPYKTEALLAASNAVQTLKDTFKATTVAYLELQKAIDASPWDRFTNFIAGAFGKGASDVYAKTQVQSLNTLIASSARYGKEQELVAKISEVLGAPRYQWAQKIAEDAPKAAKALQTIQPELEKLSNGFGEAATKSKKFDDSLKEVTTKQQDLITSLTSQTPGSKFASTLLQFAIDFKDALTDSGVAASRLNSLLSNQKNLGLFSPAVAKGLTDITAEVSKLNTASNTVETSIENVSAKLLEVTAEYDRLAAQYRKSQTQVGGERFELSTEDKQKLDSLPEQISLFKREIDRLRASKQGIYAEINKLIQDPRVGKAISESFNKSVDYMTRELDLAFRKAALSVKQAAISGLSGQGIAGVAQAQFKLDMEGINLQREANKTLEEIAKINAMTLAVQTQQQVGKMTENLRSGSLTPIEQEFKDIADAFSKVIIEGKGGEKPLIDRIKTLMPTATAEMTGPLQNMFQSLLASRATLGKGAEFKAQEDIAKQKLVVGTLEEQSAIRTKNLNISAAEVQSQLQLLSLAEQEIGYLTVGQASNKAQLSDLKAELDYKSKIEKIDTDMAIQAYKMANLGLYTEEAQKELQATAAKQKQVALQDKLNAFKQTNLTYAQDDLKREQYLTQQKQKTLETEQAIANIYQDIEIKALKDQLDLDKQRGILTAQQLMDREATIRSRETELNFIKEQASIEIEYRGKILELLNRYNSISKDTEEGQQLREGIAGEMRNEALRRQGRIAAITQTRDAQRAMNDEMAKYTDRQIQYGKVIEGTFDKMADALIEFARTGKLNFKELINSMIADLVRYELKLQMMEMYKMARPGIMKIIGSLFGGQTGSFTGLPSTGGISENPFGFAKGGAFGNGIHKFAMGGAFTNSIVDQPTLFKFAKGTGLMGEAGPEAIMPLKRDSQGNLGVRAQSGDVQVVVNNYSTEKAQARETTDSRGNRRIEVVVGDMAAGEVARGGSSTNRSMRNTFGLQPQLIRR